MKICDDDRSILSISKLVKKFIIQSTIHFFIPYHANILTGWSPVKFPHSPILHYAFSSWREKNNDKNNTLSLGKQICLTIVWGCAEILPDWLTVNRHINAFVAGVYTFPRAEDAGIKKKSTQRNKVKIYSPKQKLTLSINLVTLKNEKWSAHHRHRCSIFHRAVQYQGFPVYKTRCLINQILSVSSGTACWSNDGKIRDLNE